jgi:signal transduction histidine kinase
VLRSASLAIVLLVIAYLTLTLFHPAWTPLVSDWLRMLLAWLGLLGMVLLSRWCTRTRQPGALSWWLVSAGLLFLALTRTLRLVEDEFLFAFHVPYPSWHDLFFALQYPCYFLALLLAPHTRPRILRVRVAADACLLLGSAFALCWYFLLAPIYLSSRETGLAKLVNLSLPVGNLALLFGLAVLVLRSQAYALERVVVALLIAAFTCLLVAEFWTAILLLRTDSYQAGSPPDVFSLAFSLLVPLAGLAQFRRAQRAPAGVSALQRSQPATALRWKDLIVGLRFTFPIAAALCTSVVLLLRADHGGSSGVLSLVPLLLSLGLLGLALVRQALTVMENERLRREREAALRAATAQMETFLGIAGHELKHPLANMKLGLQMVERRIRRLLQRERVEVTDVVPLLEPVEQAEHQEERLDRLVNDLLDVARVRAGRLDLHLAPTDLVAIVREAVEEQRQVNPERALQFVCTEEVLVPVLADAHRIGQVVTNYLTNALKYSAADRPVTVGLAVEGNQVRVRVRDEGPGIPAEEQERIWEGFHRVKGIEVQSGSGVGLGLGLHICRTIIEQHQGQVGVQSARGAGSTFWFCLKLSTPEPALEGSEAGAPEDSPPDGGRRL